MASSKHHKRKKKKRNTILETHGKDRNTPRQRRPKHDMCSADRETPFAVRHAAALGLRQTLNPKFCTFGRQTGIGVSVAAFEALWAIVVVQLGVLRTKGLRVESWAFSRSGQPKNSAKSNWNRASVHTRSSLRAYNSWARRLRPPLRTAESYEARALL